MPGSVFLRGEDVELRTVEREDLDFLREHRNDPDVRRWLPRVHPQNRVQVEEMFEERISGGDGVTLLVTPADDDERLGCVSLFDVSPESGRATLAAWLAPDAQGQGYGAAATELLVGYGFDERRLDRLEAGALATNDASRALLESVGFVEEGRLRNHYFVDGEHVDRVVYGLLREEWD